MGEVIAAPHGDVRLMRPPTARQRQVLLFIHEFSARRGMPPTLREIGTHLGITSTNGVNDHLRLLERRGLIVRGDMLSRALRVTVEGLRALGVLATFEPPAPCPRCGRSA